MFGDYFRSNSGKSPALPGVGAPGGRRGRASAYPTWVLVLFWLGAAAMLGVGRGAPVLLRLRNSTKK